MVRLRTAILAIAATLALSSVPAFAALLTVVNTNDSGPGSLRDAISASNLNDDIVFAPGLTGTILLGSGMTITHNLQIAGPGEANLTLDAQGHTLPIFLVDSGRLTLSRMTIRNANGSGGGGVFYVRAGAGLTLNRTVLTNNRATHGGAIFADSGTTVLIDECTFSGNSAAIVGGAIRTVGDTTIRNSTFVGNTADSDAGAVAVLGAAVVTVTNSTFSGNQAGESGGAILSVGTINVLHSTFAGNRAWADTGGAIFSMLNTTIYNSAFVDNAGAARGALALSGNAPTTDRNVFYKNYTFGGGIDDNAGYGTTNPVVATSQPLGPLGDNLGPTQTMMAIQGGAAMCAGNLALASTLFRDQRDRPRATGCVDAGATQLQQQFTNFANPGTQVLGTSLTLSATANSGLAFTFVSSTPGVCTITPGGALTLIAPGACTISANQSGIPGYQPVTLPQTFAVIAVPAAPSITSATPGNVQIAIAFTTPSDNGSPILDYTTNCGGTTATGTTSPITVPGLMNGTPYTCTVLARNAAGNGPASAASVSVTPFTIPAAPSISGVTPGNAQVTVAFTTPANNGSAILDYTANCDGTIVAGPSSPIVVAGLVNGTAYTCTVLARNAAGNGPASAPSASVTPFTNPAAPSITTVTPGNGQVTIVFAPPTANGSPILDYTANCGGSMVTGPASPIVVAGLVNGTPYTCTVLARNVAGNGPASAPSASATPFTIPGAPTITGVTAGNGQLAVAFSAAASNGSPITGYVANCSRSMPGAASPITVVLLTNGTPYTCTVFATNAAGNGPPSAPWAPTAPMVNSYTGPSATGTGSVTASFAGGGAGCSYSVSQFIPVTGHAASPPAGNAPANTTFPHGLFDFRLTGCTPGSTIIMTITYPAALPAGTTYWKYGPTPSNTAPHWYTLPATIAGSTATFTITDGQQGDDDLLANGTIVDQGGPGVPGAPGTATAVPTLSEWMLMLLAFVMLCSAVAYRRR